MTWMQTASGRKIDPWNPDPDQIIIEDIAHHLATINRFAGAACMPYSVAQHSLSVARVVPVQDAVVGLLHDAGEYLFGDMSRPLKHSPGMETFRDGERRLREVIFAKFGLPPEIPETVRRADANMLFTERRDLLMANDDPTWGHGVIGEPYQSFSVSPWSWWVVRREFLKEFHTLTNWSFA